MPVAVDRKENKLHPYFLLHYVQFHVLMPLDLDLSPQETAEIVQIIGGCASDAFPIQFHFPGYFSGNETPLTMGVRFLKPKDDTLLLMITNYSLKTKTIEVKQLDYNLGSLYRLHEDLLIDKKYEKDDLKLQDWTNKKDFLSIANYYILDSDRSNDKLVLPTLEKLESDSDASAMTKYIGFLTRGQFYLSQKDLKNADQIYREAEKKLDDLSWLEKSEGKKVLGLFEKELATLKILLQK
jgi:hypothetical protein